jgi:hypothetical protein
LPTKDLWFLPQSGPGRQYMLEYEPIAHEGAGKALSIKMYRKFAAGEIGRDPLHHVILAFSELVYGQLGRTYQSSESDVDAFLLKTAERAASCLDMRLPPPIEPEVEKGFVLWLSTGDFASEKALTYTLVQALG